MRLTMPKLSGLYTSASGHILASNEHGDLIVLEVNDGSASMRADGEFWLCRDDGRAGRLGSLAKVVLRHGREAYHVWVEPRGFSHGSTEYGLVAIRPNERYSNRFIEISAHGELRIVNSWTDQAKFQCMEQSMSGSSLVV
ncbi:hypothetical protein BDV59DRAFT_185816 [Aspergillus ambiguus]|uniref:uncharacterized protein n=1 Tax=Aspergillus ambiguus TaxID=176160 RepID=UPI003CCDAC41